MSFSVDMERKDRALTYSTGRRGERELLLSTSDSVLLQSIIMYPTVLLRAIGIPAKETDSKIPFYIVCSSLWLLYIVILVYGFLYSEEVNTIVAVANGVWMTHALSVYTIVGVSMCRDRGLLRLYQDMVIFADDPAGDRIQNMEQCNLLKLNKDTRVACIITTLGAVANIVAVGLTFSRGFLYDFAPFPKSEWLTYSLVTVWYDNCCKLLRRFIYFYILFIFP